jgi:peptidoglycan biosynthesis protein MviN/MurJ (putative lipid II flippase)
VENIINLFILWWILRKEIGSLDERKILSSCIKFCVAAIAAGIAIQGTKLLIWPYINMTKTLGVFVQGSIGGISGMVVYIAFCSLLRSEELFEFWAAFKRRLPWNKIETVDDQGEARGI